MGVILPAVAWDQIELSERYLVSGMYDEATSLASHILKDLCCKNLTEEIEQLNDMMESAGMVLIQALKGLGRTQDTVNELLQLFGSVTAIPIQVFLAGVCFQFSEGSSKETRGLVEDYLSKWKFVDKGYYIPANAESNAICDEGCNFVVRVEEYLEIVEIYVVAILAVAMKDIDSAVSWVEKASLPEDKRQDLLRRLRSLYSADSPRPSQGHMASLTNGCESQSHYLIEPQKAPKGSEEPLNPQYTPSGENNTKQSILKLSQQRVGCIWWFHSITLKMGNRRLSISNRKLIMGCLMVLIYYILRRKRISLKENLKRRAISVRKGFVDLWELAFSYQVNPLAAVQPISTAPRWSR